MKVRRCQSAENLKPPGPWQRRLQPPLTVRTPDVRADMGAGIFC